MDSTSSQSVTQWLCGLKRGDVGAPRSCGIATSSTLIHVASKHLRDLPRRVADEEDVVVVAFGSFLRGVDDGRFAAAP